MEHQEQATTAEQFLFNLQTHVAREDTDDWQTVCSSRKSSSNTGSKKSSSSKQSSGSSFATNGSKTSLDAQQKHFTSEPTISASTVIATTTGKKSKDAPSDGGGVKSGRNKKSVPVAKRELQECVALNLKTNVLRNSIKEPRCGTTTGLFISRESAPVAAEGTAGQELKERPRFMLQLSDSTCHFFRTTSSPVAATADETAKIFGVQLAEKLKKGEGREGEISTKVFAKEPTTSTLPPGPSHASSSCTSSVEQRRDAASVANENYVGVEPGQLEVFVEEREPEKQDDVIPPEQSQHISILHLLQQSAGSSSRTDEDEVEVVRAPEAEAASSTLFPPADDELVAEDEPKKSLLDSLLAELDEKSLEEKKEKQQKQQEAISAVKQQKYAKNEIYAGLTGTSSSRHANYNCGGAGGVYSQSVSPKKRQRWVPPWNYRLQQQGEVEYQMHLPEKEMKNFYGHNYNYHAWLWQEDQHTPSYASCNWFWWYEKGGPSSTSGTTSCGRRTIVAVKKTSSVEYFFDPGPDFFDWVQRGRLNYYDPRTTSSYDYTAERARKVDDAARKVDGAAGAAAVPGRITEAPPGLGYDEDYRTTPRAGAGRHELQLQTGQSGSGAPNIGDETNNNMWSDRNQEQATKTTKQSEEKMMVFLPPSNLPGGTLLRDLLLLQSSRSSSSSHPPTTASSSTQNSKNTSTQLMQNVQEEESNAVPDAEQQDKEAKLRQMRLDEQEELLDYIVNYMKKHTALLQNSTISLEQGTAGRTAEGLLDEITLNAKVCSWLSENYYSYYLPKMKLLTNATRQHMERKNSAAKVKISEQDILEVIYSDIKFCRDELAKEFCRYFSEKYAVPKAENVNGEGTVSIGVMNGGGGK
ncbi:unnamed protein product [Amoebophrya sp. A120]|nr:unnamed protein product [Amoebophrya sp. A120]|eukprot:GSA120T00022454001.1